VSSEAAEDPVILQEPSVLDDESVWGIQVVDRVNSGIWLESDDVDGEKNQRGPQLPLWLINTDEHETAHAKYMGNHDVLSAQLARGLPALKRNGFRIRQRCAQICAQWGLRLA
jgi:hypothetical protein